MGGADEVRATLLSFERDMPAGLALVVADSGQGLILSFDSGIPPSLEHNVMVAALRTHAGWPDNPPISIHDLPAESEIFNGLNTDRLYALRDDIMEGALGRSWPICRVHATHPLTPVEEGWSCGRDGGATWPYGSLASVAVAPQPYRAGGEIRFLVESGGWRVIAHSEGDVWFHVGAVDNHDFDRLREGQLLGSS